MSVDRRALIKALGVPLLPALELRRASADLSRGEEPRVADLPPASGLQELVTLSDAEGVNLRLVFDARPTWTKANPESMNGGLRDAMLAGKQLVGCWVDCDALLHKVRSEAGVRELDLAPRWMRVVSFEIDADVERTTLVLNLTREHDATFPEAQPEQEREETAEDLGPSYDRIEVTNGW